jgi:hypothetical protein
MPLSRPSKNRRTSLEKDYSDAPAADAEFLPTRTRKGEDQTASVANGRNLTGKDVPGGRQGQEGQGQGSEAEEEATAGTGAEEEGQAAEDDLIEGGL